MERRGSLDRQKSTSMERVRSAASMNRQKSAVSTDRRSSVVPMDRQKSAVPLERRNSSGSVDRQKSAVALERRNSTVSMDPQKSPVTTDRKKSAMGARSNSMGNIRSSSAQVSRSNSKLDKGQPKGKGKVFEFPCMPCERENKNIEATNYCSNCSENLCADCVKQHQKFSSMKNHKIFGKADRRKGDSSAPAINPLECASHPGKLVEMYCEDHNEIWCGACIAVHHRKCKNTMLLEKAAKGILQSNEFRDVRENIKLVRKDLVVLRKKTDSNLVKLEKQKTAVINKIKAYRQKINQAIDKLEDATVKQLDQAVERAKQFTEDDKKLYNDMVSTLDTVLNMVIKTKGKDFGESAVFVGVKRAKQRIVEGQRVLKFTKNSIVQEALRFVPDTRIIDWLKSLNQLGTFEHQQRSYTGVLMGKYNIKTKNDSTQCDVFGCDMLPDGRLLLTDWDNQNVKLLDTNYNVVQQCRVQGNPVDICCINPEQAVTSLTRQKMLEFIHIDETVKTTRTLALEDSCRGVAYHDGQIFVVCGGFKNEGDGCIRVFSVSGEPLRVVKDNNVNQKIFASPIALSIDRGGALFHITDGQRGVITMTSSNDVVSIISCEDVTWPCGICMDREGNALICNGKSNSVIQMSTLSKFTTVLKYEDGIKNPRAICFDQNNLRLIVVSKSDCISVFQLHARCMSDVAKDLKPTTPKEENPVPVPENVESQKDKSTKKSDDKKDLNKKTEKIENGAKNEEVAEENKRLTKSETKPVAGKQNSKQTEEASDQKKTPAFKAMVEKVLKSEQLLKAIQEVSRANTAPENGPKAEGKANKQPKQKPAGKTMDSPLTFRSSLRQSKTELPNNKEPIKDSKNIQETEHQELTGKTDKTLVSSRKPKEWLIVNEPEIKPRESATKLGKRPITASTTSTVSRGKTQLPDEKSKATTLPSAINAITPRTKDKEKTQLKPRLTSSLSRSLKPESSSSEKTSVIQTVDKLPEINPDTNQKVTGNAEKDDGGNSNLIDNTNSKQKEQLTKQNQKVNTSLQSLRTKKVAPTPRPSTRDSSSTRSSRQTGISVKKK